MTTRNAEAVAASVSASIDRAVTRSLPFRHLLLDDVLPPSLSEAIAAIPIAAADIDDTRGKRETHNSLRVFFDPVRRALFPCCEAVAAAFQGEDIAAAFERRFGIDLNGTYLRIEYCQDRDGFWLEPHTDIGVKRVTLLIYLSDRPQWADWGTDLYDPSMRRIARAEYRPNAGLAFVPAGDTWHGFEPRPINGIRKSLIVNFVAREWRARHELSFPDLPVGTAKGLAA